MCPNGGQQICSSRYVHAIKLVLGITPDSPGPMNDGVTVSHELLQGSGVFEVALNKGNTLGDQV